MDIQEDYDSSITPLANANEKWRCAVQVSDKHGRSEWTFSEHVTIAGNEEPVNETIEENCKLILS